MGKKLKDMEYGNKAVIREIDDELKGKLAGMGIRVGKELIFKTKQPIDGPVVVEVNGSTTSMGIGMAGKITVEVID
ncbi:MAG: FeoA family protein [Candidatus Natronoplasma sp.]